MPIVEVIMTPNRVKKYHIKYSDGRSVNIDAKTFEYNNGLHDFIDICNEEKVIRAGRGTVSFSEIVI